jgi:hypothetical protein
MMTFGHKNCQLVFRELVAKQRFGPVVARLLGIQPRGGRRPSSIGNAEKACRPNELTRSGGRDLRDHAFHVQDKGSNSDG